ncbi:hypothetical protein [Actinomadura madurae]|uniref:hypothetical protein n=1 Tax=Actinomadura madurae TaxID=1993 RepID=UPI0027E246C5|nr:hypothetical protein [Actinomadura madurae]
MRDELQQPVAGGVPEGVVDLLEPVEVEQEQPGPVARRLGGLAAAGGQAAARGRRRSAPRFSAPRASASASSVRTISSLRFGRPVSPSCRAWCSRRTETDAFM